LGGKSMNDAITQILIAMEKSFPKTIVRYVYTMNSPDSTEQYYVFSLNEDMFHLPISVEDIDSSIKDGTFDKTYQVIEDWGKDIVSKFF
jgi:hypothetical protein